MVSIENNTILSGIRPSTNLQAFLARHHHFVSATTTLFKVKNFQALFRQLGVNQERIVSGIAAPSEPSDWARPEEIAEAKVNQVSSLSTCPLLSLVIGTDSTIAVNGDPVPIGKLHGTVEDVIGQLNQLVGSGSYGFGEMVVGFAIGSQVSGRTVIGRVIFPFTFIPLTTEEIKTDVYRNPVKVNHRAGGCDFAGSWAEEHLISVHGIFKGGYQYSSALGHFQNTALGFPVEGLVYGFEQLAGFSKGSESVLRVYPPAPIFSSNR